MNERIKELAEQATDKEHGYSFFDREKFAELIVRECADIATINSHQQYSAGHYVLKHFGLGGV
jgi:hypothetical protein